MQEHISYLALLTKDITVNSGRINPEIACDILDIYKSKFSGYLVALITRECFMLVFDSFIIARKFKPRLKYLPASYISVINPLNPDSSEMAETVKVLERINF